MFMESTSNPVSRVSYARLKQSYRTSLYVSVCANGAFGAPADLLQLHFLRPPQVSRCLLVIRRLSGCSASLSSVSSYTAGVFYWGGCDLLLCVFCVFSPPSSWILQSGTTVVTGWSWRSEHFTYIHTSTAEHGASLMGGHYHILKKESALSLEQGERFMETLWAQISSEGVTAHRSETHWIYFPL